ncbi:motility protein A [Borrelia parkeri]|uniref:Chemotaxis motA protein n=1 Tax=Borrelia parkeri SLO TaxID=1313294 RepID=A0ABM5PKF0_BORPR|nr:motility protein A [Borrelia parkeri]AHE62615.1 Motility protein A [Borrelia parkeri HR1]AHH09652.1 Chemotaxis motA protein [Borrelia parkeri SLO]UPA10460.1 motility protein A [Borrelia parkeri]
MNLASIVGWGVGFGAILISMAFTPTGLGVFWDLSSVFITVVGSFSALVASSEIPTVKKIPTYLGFFFKKSSFGKVPIIKTLVELSEKARKEGLLSLDDELDQINDPFFKSGMRLVVDGADPEIIRTMLYLELDQMQERHKIGADLFGTWAKLAPAFGMTGTLIGLIALLGNLEDRSALGSSMAVALITTLYGTIMANLMLLPIQIKLEFIDIEEASIKTMIVEGILSIQAGDNPRILEQKLVTFLTPKDRSQLGSGILGGE